jgi:hypothetical protein
MSADDSEPGKVGLFVSHICRIAARTSDCGVWIDTKA